MMFCKKCGTRVEEGVKFCPVCGMLIVNNQNNVNSNMNGQNSVNTNQNIDSNLMGQGSTNASISSSLDEKNNGVVNQNAQNINNSVSSVDNQNNNGFNPFISNDSQTNETINQNLNSVQPNQTINQNPSGVQPNQTVNQNPSGQINQTMNSTSNSGEKVMPSNNIHNSIIRKAIKKDAKGKPKGALAGIFGLQFAITVLFALVVGVSAGGLMLTDKGAFTSGVILLFMGLLFVVMFMLIILDIGITKSSLTISRGENVTFKSAFKGIFSDFSFNFKAIGGMGIFSAIPLVLSYIPFVGNIVGLVLQIYFLPVMIIFVYTMLDAKCEDGTFGSVLKKSMELAKGHRVEFYGLAFSFIGWILLAILTFGILCFWLMPYIRIAVANWYRSLKGEVIYSEGEKGISNGGIIAIACGAYLVFIVAIILTVIFAVSNAIDSSRYDDYEYSDTYDDYDYNDYGDSDYSDTYDEYYSDTNTNNDPKTFSVGSNNNYVTFIIPDGQDLLLSSNETEARLTTTNVTLTYTYENTSANDNYNNKKSEYTKLKTNVEGTSATINNVSVKMLIHKNEYLSGWSETYVYYPVSNGCIVIKFSAYNDLVINASNVSNYIKVK